MEKTDVEILRQDLRDLSAKVDALIRVCSRMDEHITFVNRTYDVVRSPMNWLMDRINYYAPGSYLGNVYLPASLENSQ